MDINITDRIAKTLASVISSIINNNVIYNSLTKLDFDKVVDELESIDPNLAKQIKKWKDADKRAFTSSSHSYNDGGWCGRVSNYGCGSSPSRYDNYSGCGSSSYSRSSC